jgi:chromosome segregation ATPase
LETTKNDSQSDVDAIKAECAKKLRDKPSDAGRKAKELEDQIAQLTEIVRDFRGQIVTEENNASELANKIVKLTDDLTMRDEQLEAKTEESSKMENDATALAEEVQGFK